MAQVSKIYDVVGTRPGALSRMTSPVRWATPKNTVTVKDGRRVFNNVWRAPKVIAPIRAPRKSLFA